MTKCITHHRMLQFTPWYDKEFDRDCEKDVDLFFHLSTQNVRVMYIIE